MTREERAETDATRIWIYLVYLADDLKGSRGENRMGVRKIPRAAAKTLCFSWPRRGSNNGKLVRSRTETVSVSLPSFYPVRLGLQQENSCIFHQSAITSENDFTTFHVHARM